MLDNLDGCPNNPTKTVPDICGCDKGPMFADNIALKNAVMITLVVWMIPTATS